MGRCSSSAGMGALGTGVNVGVSKRKGSRNSPFRCFWQHGEERDQTA